MGPISTSAFYYPKKDNDEIMKILRREIVLGVLMSGFGPYTTFLAWKFHDDPFYVDGPHGTFGIQRSNAELQPFLWTASGIGVTLMGLLSIVSTFFLYIGVKKGNPTRCKLWWAVYYVLFCATAVRTVLFIAWAEHVYHALLILTHLVWMVVQWESMITMKKFIRELMKRNGIKEEMIKQMDKTEKDVTITNEMRPVLREAADAAGEKGKLHYEHHIFICFNEQKNTKKKVFIV